MTFAAPPGRQPRRARPAPYAFTAAVRLLARALQAGHRDRAAVGAWPEGVGRGGRAAAFGGVARRVEFDQNGDPVNKRFTMGGIRGGGIVLPEAGR